MLNFFKAERTGDWKLHLHCMREMIPYFHVAGHFPYAKSARLYLHKTETISEVMSPDDYRSFSDKGYFTIRQTNDFWAGNFSDHSDQIIEQFLMRMLKTTGGMTHDSGITDSTLTKWVHALPGCVPVCDALEKFTSVHTSASEQHKDLRSPTQAKYNKDFIVFKEWLQVHQQFAGYQPHCLVSIATGVVANTSVNCDDAVKIGLAVASKIAGKSFTDITLHRKDKVKTMGDKPNTNTVREKNTVINPDLFFNRITYVLKSSSGLEEFMSFELAPQPSSLFHDGVMRKPNKSALSALLKSFVSTHPHMPDKCQYVLDGGHLLQRVVWPQHSAYRDVCRNYVAYTLNHYGTFSTVIFDGYATISTKTAEQQRRAKKTPSSNILFDLSMKTTTSQAAFLANGHNKE